MARPRNLVLTGGVFHPFETAAPALAEALGVAGIDSTVTEDFDGGLAALARGEFELLTVYALRWSMTQHEKYAPFRARYALELAADARAAITAHVARGRGLLGLHTASICFDTWAEWGSVLGGAWVWGHSGHPPLGPVEVEILVPGHPLVRDLPGFRLDDEVYGNLTLEPDVVPLMQARAIDTDAGWHPVLWERRYGRGRVVYSALGHDLASISHPVHAEIIARSARWALGLI